jgi:87kDa Transposase
LQTDGHEYIAGFIARKMRNEFPYMGNYTYETENSGSYIDNLSFGGLTKPSNIWQQQFNLLEKLFIDMHGDVKQKFCRNDDGNFVDHPYQRLCQAAKHLYGINDINTPPSPTKIHVKIIERFFLIRIFIRIKEINKRLSQDRTQSILENRNKRKQKTINVSKMTSNFF